MTLKRRKPLKRTGFTPTQRATKLTRTTVSKKRAKVTPQERNARKVTKARSEGRCEIHGNHPATDMHHRQNRSQGGQWSPENLLHLCHAVHMAITTSPQQAMEQGWTVRSGRNPGHVPCWLAGRGWAFLSADGSITEAIDDEEVA